MWLDICKEVRGLLKKGKRGDALLAIVNKTDPLALSIESGLFTAESKPYLKGMSKPGLGPE